MLVQSFTPPGGNKGSNLKVLPKDISEEELIPLMKGYAMSLGVKCNYCHVPLPADATQLDFTSDAKEEKRNARKMMVMVKDINKKYLGKMEEGFEAITCATCHMGHVKPLVSVDSLMMRPY